MNYVLEQKSQKIKTAFGEVFIFETVTAGQFQEIEKSMEDCTSATGKMIGLIIPLIQKIVFMRDGEPQVVPSADYKEVFLASGVADLKKVHDHCDEKAGKLFETKKKK